MITFEELQLIKPLQRALTSAGYVRPTAIQAKTLPAALDGFDVLGCAQTGTGKTAAFTLPILDFLGSENIPVAPGRPQALILAPTRELAIQIGASIEGYGRHLPLRTAVVFGGVSQFHQVKAISRGVHILVATPGRLLDLMNQGHVQLRDVDIFVLDEADRMLDMGFLPDIKRIVRQLPEERQSLFFSATLPPKIVALAKQLLFEPVQVNVAPTSPTVDKIEQQVLLVDKNAKGSQLQSLLGDATEKRTVVFTRTKRGASTLERKLKQRGISAAAIHGNKSQSARQRTLDAFRGRRLDVLVATDVASRGIDVDDVTHVINFDLPTDPESYVHRIGRTGRAGASGIAISLYTADQLGDLRAIERYIGKKLGNDELNRSSREQQPTSQTPHTKTKLKSKTDSPARKTNAQQLGQPKPKPRDNNGSAKVVGV